MDAKELGIDRELLGRVAGAVEADVAAERYDGAVLMVARRGQLVLEEAIGFADRAGERRASLDDVFCLFSVTKTMTAAAVLARVDRGEIALTTPVAEVLPEFGVKGKQRVTVGQLLTHTGGMSADLPFLLPDQMGDLDVVAAAVCNQPLAARPGDVVSYSPLGGHAVLGKLVHRLDGETRPFREILADEFFVPLGMKETALGLRPDLASRRVPVVVRDRSPGLFEPELLEAMNFLLAEDSEIPGGGAISTGRDILRWAEMLRRGGEIDGTRVLSKALLELATQNHTGQLPNRLFDYMREARGWDEFPAYLGLGFFLRGSGIFPTPFGLTSSPSSFGGLGAGSTMFLVDRERELSFVCLTSGLLEESRNFERLQRLSDLVLASIID
jgi:CubicO group peptidase (beta-lactamase class C family)